MAQIVTMVGQNGLQWMASDEGVLANSLGLDSFTRNAEEVVVEADQLYRPYYVQGSRGGPVAMVFRDVAISDKVGFTYSGMPGETAAEDFVDRVHAIRRQLEEDGVEGPHLRSVILDGENAWEFYDNDGKEFLHSLYQMLSDDPLIKTVTPSEFLDIAPTNRRSKIYMPAHGLIMILAPGSARKRKIRPGNTWQKHAISCSNILPGPDPDLSVKMPWKRR